MISYAVFCLKKKETEFRQQQEREREQARDAQLKLRELAAKELKERVQLERELVKQQQQNVISVSYTHLTLPTTPYV